MNRAVAIRRLYREEPATCTNPGNLGTFSEHAARESAITGSTCLLLALERTGLRPSPAEENPHLTFEEQLRLVESGRGRLVERVEIRRREPEMTMGGTTDWDSLG